MLFASHRAALELADDVRFLTTVRAALIKTDATGKAGASLDETSSALRAMVSAAIATDGVVDVFAEAGLANLSCPSFLTISSTSSRHERQREPMIKMLQKLLNDESGRFVPISGPVRQVLGTTSKGDQPVPHQSSYVCADHRRTMSSPRPSRRGGRGVQLGDVLRRIRMKRSPITNRRTRDG